MQKPIKLILAILLLLCVFNWPYAYYQFVRLCAMLGFSYLAFEAHQEDKKTELIVCILLAILFQPLIKISLGRTLWNILDVLIGLGLTVSALKGEPNKNNN
jgi:hypothetical protein